MQYVIAALAVAPFVALLVAMARGKAEVRPCCRYVNGQAMSTSSTYAPPSRNSSARIPSTRKPQDS